MLSRPVLLYDGECGFCRKSAARLARWDRRGAIALVPLLRRGELPDLPDIPSAALQQSIHLVLPDGTYYRGGEIAPVLLGYLPGGLFLKPLFLLPGADWISRWVYDRVAARRHRTGTCEAGS